jgi:hypothetical protein
MPTMRSRRAQEYRPPLSRPLAVWLMTGDLAAAIAARTPGTSGFAGGVAHVLLDGPDQHRAVWEAHATALCAEYTAEHHGRRPWGWWRYAAVEGRRQLGGVGRPVLGPYGPHRVESWREFRGLPILLNLAAADPPIFEAEAATLRRLGVLTRDEARRLDLSVFDPVEMVVHSDSALGYGPRGEELDDEDAEQYEWGVTQNCPSTR